MNRILLIEDDAGAQLLYRNRLTDLGYQVVVSTTGAMGLMEARSASFDLFLVDIGLGSGIDGYEVCRRLKTIPEIRGVPVVLISGHVKTQGDLHRGYEAGCQSFLVKGDLMLLEDVVRAMLRIKSLQDDLALQNRLLEERNRRQETEKARSADPENEHRGAGHGAREPVHPDGMLLVDSDGVVRTSDRGARDLFGQVVTGKHLALVAPDSRLEALVRNARTEPNESVRFEIPERHGRSARALLACIYPFVPQAERAEPALRVVLLFESVRQRSSESGRGAQSLSQRRESAPLIEAAREVFRPSALLGSSAVQRALRATVARAARAEGPVLVQGPSGSGKGFVARILHFSGARSGPFLTVGCGAFGAGELELELFGSVGGAPERLERPGAFQQASGGTLFLQDVERLSAPLQQRLHAVLVEGRVLRQGSSVPEPVDVRVVAGTSFGLERALEQRQFQRELAHELSALRIVLPPLAQRPEDVEALARHFLARHCPFDDAHFSPEALQALAAHDWPENVRELERTVQSICEVTRAGEILLSDLPPPFPELCRNEVAASAPPPRPPGDVAGLERELDALLTSLDSTVSLLDAYEKGALLHALRLTRGDKLAAARLLRIGKSTFYRKLKQHGIS